MGFALHVNLNTAREDENVHNAALPVWRDALIHAVPTTYVDSAFDSGHANIDCKIKDMEEKKNTDFTTQIS